LNLFRDAFCNSYRNKIEKDYFNLDFREIQTEDSFYLPTYFKDYEIKIPDDLIRNQLKLKIRNKEKSLELIDQQVHFYGYERSAYDYDKFDSYTEFHFADYVNQLLEKNPSDKRAFWVRNQRNVYFEYGSRKYYPDFLLFKDNQFYIVETKCEIFADHKKNALLSRLEHLPPDEDGTSYKGLLVFSIIFLFLGIPDIFFHWNGYLSYFKDNIVSGPMGDSNYLLGMPAWVYLLFINFPNIFGHIFYVLFIFSLIYWLTTLSVEKFVYKQLQHKKELFLIISCLIYACSLIILGLGATGNRLLVLLPFLTLLTGLFIRQIFVSRYKRFIIIFLFSLFLLQLAETANFVIAKLVSSPEETSSIWIQKHIAKGSEIGIENIPIYQSLPDVVLKEFYEEQNKISSRYMYQVIDAHTLKLPHFVIITDYQFDTEYLRDSVKKDLLQRLQKEHYRIVAQFSPYHGLYTVLGNELNYRLAGLTMTRPITIYEKR